MTGTEAFQNVMPMAPDGHANKNLHVEMLEPEMEDMLETILEENNLVATDMKHNACTPLYEGSRISCLKTVLELLNLQASFGWSDKSVTELFR